MKRVLLTFALLAALCGNAWAEEASPIADNEGFVNSYDVTYETARGASTGDEKIDGNIMAGQEFSGGLYNIRRAFLCFAIPSMSSVSSAVLHLDGLVNGSTTDFDLYVVSSTYDTPLDTGDFDLCGIDSYNDTWNSTSYSNDDNEITFSAAGLGAVLAAQGDTLRIALRSSRDISATAPSGLEYCVFSANPVLTITYSTGWSHNFSGIEAPANVWGVDKAEVANVWGVGR